jgi:hypothetical protein
MPADSSSACLVERLNSALDRLEIALETTAIRLREAEAASLVLKAMEEDRAALAVELDKARARVAARGKSAAAAEAAAAAAARAVKEALEEPPERDGDG